MNVRNDVVILGLFEGAREEACILCIMKRNLAVAIETEVQEVEVLGKDGGRS